MRFDLEIFDRKNQYSNTHSYLSDFTVILSLLPGAVELDRLRARASANNRAGSRMEREVS